MLRKSEEKRTAMRVCLSLYKIVISYFFFLIMYPKFCIEKVWNFYETSKCFLGNFQTVGIPEMAVCKWVKGQTDCSREALKTCGSQEDIFEESGYES